MGTATRTEATLEQTLTALARDLREFVASQQRARDERPQSTRLKRAQERCKELADRVNELRTSVADRREHMAHAITDRRSAMASALSERTGAMAQAFGERREALGDALNELRSSLQAVSAGIKASRASGRIGDWRTQLVGAYEDFVARIRAAKVTMADGEELRDIRVPRFARSALHAGIGVGCVLLYELLVTRGQALAILLSLVGLFATLEITRRFSKPWNDFLTDKVFGAISRPRERYKINSASFYLLALTIIAFIAPKSAVCVACLVLAFGDPIASAIGHRFGRKPIYNDKSLIGSFAFFVSSVIAVVAYALIAQPAWGLGLTLGIAGVAALVGAFVELFSVRIDDNLSIPVATALVVMLLL